MMNEYWIAGKPATYATKSERTWKISVFNTLKSVKQYSGDIEFEFVFKSEYFNKVNFDVDNLCEPVFAVLTSKMGWFGGKRTTIHRWKATKRVGDIEGMYIRAFDVQLNKDTERKMIFNGIYKGVFPNKATDDSIPKWINNGYKYIRINQYGISFEFGSNKLSIATISDGKVKHIIDCLYPVIGGKSGYPEDNKINSLVVERNTVDLGEDEVRIRIWEY